MAKGPGGKTYLEGESWKTGSSLRQERLEAFLEWMLTPEPLRDPPSKKAFAQFLGVSESTLWRYEQDRWFQREFMKRRRGLFKVTDAESVLKAQIKIASDPDNRASTQAARFLFDWMDKLDDKQGHTTDLSELDEEELLSLLNEYVKRDN